MLPATLKRHSTIVGFVAAAVSVGILILVRIHFIFQSGNTAGTLLLLALLTTMLALVCGIAALPKWSGFVILTLVAVLAYCLLFLPLYAVA